VAEQKIARDETRCGPHRALAIQRRQEQTQQVFRIDGECRQRIVALVGDARGRHVEKANEIKAHRAVKYAPQEPGVGRASRPREGDPFQQLMQCVAVRKDIVRRVPVRELVARMKRATRNVAA
jgi:hypothetical protein